MAPSSAQTIISETSEGTTGSLYLGSADMAEKKRSWGKLVDGYGNEFKVPGYTFKQIKDAIPAHCFERSAATGFLYIAQDLSIIAGTFYLTNKYVTPEYISSWYLRTLLWAAYTVLQGMVGIGIWVLAHECNHGAFSDSTLLNDTVGWVLHSALLVPYFSWKLTHKTHHAIHNNLAKDMQFVPKTREEYGKHTGNDKYSSWETMEDTPFWTAMELMVQQVIGWPQYLLTNDSGTEAYQNRPDGRGIGKDNGFGGGVNHFDPASPLFNANEWHLILLSDLGLFLTLTATVYAGYNYGWLNILVWYWIPYLWVNHWLVVIAYLHHTDPALPKYQPEAWTYLRGAAATMDREFGWIGHHFFHDIIETHVLHHTIPTIPFYHAREATEAIKPVMGEHYKADTEGGSIGFLKSAWRNARWCQWVEPNEDAQDDGKHVWFYRNKNGLGVPPSRKTM